MIPFLSNGVVFFVSLWSINTGKMNDVIKQLTFNKRTNINEAFQLPLCKRLYNELVETKGVEYATGEALALCNDVLWAIFIGEFEDHTWDRKYPIPDSGTSYDWQWVIAQLTDTNIETYYEDDSIDVFDYYEFICDSSSSFEFDYRDEKLIELYTSIRGETKKTWPKLLEYCGYFETLKVANVNEWPSLLSIEFYSLTSNFREIIIDEIARQCLTYRDACRLKELLEEYVYHFQNFYILPEYPLLCRTIVEMQKYERIKHDESMKRVEANVLELKKGNKALNTDYIIDFLQKLMDTNIIPVDKRHGFVWYAVWLFFKKMDLLKDKSQSAFEELMSVWFPGCGYGKSDLMRRYNSKFLEKNNWQIWDYKYFKQEKEEKKRENKNGKDRYSQSGFEEIKELYRTLETYLKPRNYWIKLY